MPGLKRLNAIVTESFGADRRNHLSQSWTCERAEQAMHVLSLNCPFINVNKTNESYLLKRSISVCPALHAHKNLCLSQGRIACANVLSDLYAMGITECDNMLMLLSVSQKMNEKVPVPSPFWLQRIFWNIYMFLVWLRLLLSFFLGGGGSSGQTSRTVHLFCSTLSLFKFIKSLNFFLATELSCILLSF